MKRYWSSRLIAVGCCTAFVLQSTTLFGDDPRTAVFRKLTSEPSGVSQVERASAAPEARSELTVAAPRETKREPTYTARPVAAPTLRPVSFSGGQSARQTMSQFPRRAAILPNPRRATGRQPKPFETAEHEPTISPYLHLDRDDEKSEGLPNYLTLVLPQIEQMQTNRLQQREIQQLRGQIQTMTANAGATPVVELNRSTGMKASSRFMDTAQFYGGSR